MLSEEESTQHQHDVALFSAEESGQHHLDIAVLSEKEREEIQHEAADFLIKF